MLYNFLFFLRHFIKILLTLAVATSTNISKKTHYPP
uniref:Uncharacterized protein n=1 Tax=Anguilla anguilla TaxID=7936 RepID=A0A0E9P8N4_ANGAN